MTAIFKRPIAISLPSLDWFDYDEARYCDAHWHSWSAQLL